MPNIHSFVNFLALKAKLKEHNARLVTISQEKAKLEAKNKVNAASDVASQEQAKLAFNNKQITLKQLKDKLQDMEKQVGNKEYLARHKDGRYKVC